MKPLTNHLNALASKLQRTATGITDGFVTFLAAVVTVLFVAAITLGVKG